VRLDDVEFYHAVFQVVGRSTVLQNDQAVTLDVGEVALVDSTRPVTYVNDAYAQALSLQLPRRSVMSHLGLEPQGGSGGRRGTRAGRLLFQLVLDEFKDELTCPPASLYMQLAVYDLIGEIFTPSDPKAVSLYTDKQGSGAHAAHAAEACAGTRLRQVVEPASPGRTPLIFRRILFTQLEPALVNKKQFRPNQIISTVQHVMHYWLLFRHTL
jgi:hypothetical protein